ncbi:MAG: HAD family hydrolase [Streptococcus pyogenes]|nr:MAG: HAD family hydrolase [Streptococcus pyogenes]
MIKLVATDMDGTFLREDGTYDKDRLARLLPKLQEAGIIFAVSSGRSLLAINRLFEDFLDQIAIIAENGSLVQYQGRVIFSDALSKSQYLEVAAKIKANPYHGSAGMLFSGQKASYILEGTSPAYIEKMKHYYANVQIIETYDLMDEDLIFKMTTSFTDATVLLGSDWLDQALPYATAVTTGFDSIDVMLSGVNKGFGLQHLCQALNLSLNQTLAFGDNFNDLQMLTCAGKAIATANARPEIKAVADELIGHCNSQAVLQYLERMVRDEAH